MKVETAKNVLEMFDHIDIAMAYHSILCGNLIGSGAFRNVYECGFDATCVVKIDVSQFPSNNVLEWEIWDTLK